MTNRRPPVFRFTRPLLERRWLSGVLRESEEPTVLTERGVTLQAARWGGGEFRPTRVFLWIGPTRDGREWVLSTGLPPHLFSTPRRRRHLQIGSCHLSFLGNPAFTVTLLAANAMRRLFDGNGHKDERAASAEDRSGG